MPFDCDSAVKHLAIEVVINIVVINTIKLVRIKEFGKNYTTSESVQLSAHISEISLLLFLKKLGRLIVIKNM